MTAYINPSVQWPLQQNRQETKHLSGLLSVSADFVSLNATSAPTKIESSIGELDVYPPPTAELSEGLLRYTATAYGIWDSTKKEEIYGITPAEITLWAVYYLWTDETKTQTTEARYHQKKIRVNVETYYAKTVNSEVPICPDLKIFNQVGQDITSITYQFPFSEIGLTVTDPPSLPVGSGNTVTMFKKTKYGNSSNIEEIEISYIRAGLDIFFGAFYVDQVA